MAGDRKYNNKKSIKIQCDNGIIYDIPKGEHFVMNIRAAHYDYKYWTNEKNNGIDMSKVHLKFWLDEEAIFKKHNSFLKRLSRQIIGNEGIICCISNDNTEIL